MNETSRLPRRVRHDLRFRALTVASARNLTPTMRRIVLEGEALEGFTSLGFDDHVKLFPVAPGQALTLPIIGPDGPVFPEPRPVARDYTPRAYDAETRQLTIDFVVGHGGPATEWAEAATPGDVVGIGGPRGSFIVPTAFADHVLIGDETALPAIGRRLEELPAGVRAHVAVEVADASSRLPLSSLSDLSVIWVERGACSRPDRLADAAAAMLAAVDPSDAYVWIAAESAVAKTLRARALAMGFSPTTMKAAGYWRRGALGAHEIIEA